MTEKDVSLSIGGEPEGLEAALAQAKSIVSRAMSDMSRNVGELQTAFSRARGTIIAMTAVLAGGAGFKAMADGASELAKQSEDLGRQLGIGATEASALKIALGDVFATEEQVSSATGKITETLNRNEGAFTRLGVATRDSNGNLRNSLDILLDVNGRLGELREGTDRNVVGVQLFGRSWSSIEPLIKLNADAMRQATEKGRELGLVLTKEGAESAEKYRNAMNDAGDVMLALRSTAGDALLPMLTRLGNWFSSIGPTLVAGFRTAMAQLTAAMEVAVGAVRALVAGLGLAFDVMASQVSRVGAFAAAALTGDWEGAKAAWEGNFSELEAAWTGFNSRLATIAAETEQHVNDALGFAKPPDGTEIGRPEGGGRGEPAGESGAGKGRVSQWSAELAEAKVAWQEKQRLEGSFREFSRQQELDYWQTILATQNANAAEQVALRSKIAGLALAIDTERFAAEITGLKAQEDSYRANGEAKVALTQEIAERMRAAYGEESREYAAARADVLKAERELQAQLEAERRVHAESARTLALLAVDAEEEAMRERFANQEASAAEMLEAERAFAERRNDIRREAIAEAIAIAEADPDRDRVKLAELHAQLEELERTHQIKLGEIRRRELRASTSEWDGAMSSIEGGFSRSIASMLKGTSTLTQGTQSMAAAVVGSMIDMVGKMVAEWVLANTIQRAVTRQTAVEGIAADAGKSGSGAFAAIAAIPVVGPFLAPAAAATAFAAAMGYASKISAAKGYDIPPGVNPVTQLHQSEMVLPEELANVVRSVAGEGGGGGRRPVSVNISTVDARGFARLLDRHSGALIDTLAKALRGSRLR